MVLLGTLALPLSIVFEIYALKNPSDYRLKIAATVTSLYSLLYFLQFPPAGTFMQLWPLGMNIYSQANRCINHLWLRDSDEFARKVEVAAVDEKKRWAKLSVTEALDISLTTRGLGWRFQVRRLPFHALASSTRVHFAFSQILGAILRFIALDLGISLANTSLTTLDDISIPLRLALGALMVLYVRWVMDIPYRIFSALTVLAGVYFPADWPPLFGRWDDAYTVRRFWSHNWHACMSLIAGPPVQSTVARLGWRKGSYLARWGVVVGNFVMAFADHAYGRVMAGGHPKYDFFMFALQPIAIWVEDTIRDVAVACGLVDKDSRSGFEVASGYIWVAMVECWTFLDFMDGAIRLHGNVPASTLIEPVFGLSVMTPLLGPFLSCNVA